VKRSPASCENGGCSRRRGAPYSIDAPAEIIDSSCDVLLTDSATVLALDSQVPSSYALFLTAEGIMIEMDDKESASSKLARKGVTGYLLKEAAVADVISTVRGVAQGEALTHLARHVAASTWNFKSGPHSS